MVERPGVYVHVEVGFARSQNHATHIREMTYTSRSMRDRALEFPRQLPPVNTDFLSAPTGIDNPNSYNVAPEQQHYAREHTRIHSYNPQSNEHFYEDGGPIQQEATLNPLGLIPPLRNPPRRGSHERGHSAPPPFSSNPWDARPESAGTASTARPRAYTGRADVWKDLPATPNQFRLGEEEMPWDTWTFPMGLNEDADGDRAFPPRGDSLESRPADYDGSEASIYSKLSQSRNGSVSTTWSATMRTSIPEIARAEIALVAPPRLIIEDRSSRPSSSRQPSRPSSSRQPSRPPSRSGAPEGLEKGLERERERDHGKTEIESLAAAMLTVDNGFEDQWWYQGSRLVNVAGELLTPEGVADFISQNGTSTCPGTEGEEEGGVSRMSTQVSRSKHTPQSSASIADLVSPLSTYGSPVPVARNRSMTTRSQF